MLCQLCALMNKSNVATHVFDIWAGMNSDNITVLHAEVVADNSVDTRRSVVKIVVSEDNENSVLALLSLYQDGVATEELECLHGVV